ncbi:tripartite tricarboxylate transporter TctB family protein [Citricoccus nitrophenolicus]|uniref:tripartite tricarboxylate transporter TctB family protein n=1 Tax=Citricoccus muralis TaxID=169134 RepID=UPI001475FF4C|nr:tripartite tricarboxylate transporter TctB family protein [Citricoccus muralis]
MSTPDTSGSTTGSTTGSSAGTAERPGDHPEDLVLLKNLPYRLRELIPVVASVGLGITILVLVGGITDRGGDALGPRFWPTMLAWALIGLGVLLVFTNVLRGVRPSDIPEDMNWTGIGQMAATFAVLIGYLLLFNVLQFWLITMVVTVVLLLLYGIRNWKVLVFLPIIIGALLHLLFIVLLKVPL